MKRVNNKKNLYKSIILLVIVIIGIGYAYLTSNLSIAGNTSVSTNTWNIYFDNLVMTSYLFSIFIVLFMPPSTLMCLA